MIPEGNSKEDLDQRKEIISNVYREWTEKHPEKKVYNPSLKGDINIRFLSITETIRHAAKTYKSTQALLELDTILRNATIIGKPRTPKKDVDDGRREAFRRNDPVLYYGSGQIKKEIDRLARSNEVIAKFWTSNRTVPLLISGCKDTTYFVSRKYFNEKD